jgi:hypothetical protein
VITDRGDLIDQTWWARNTADWFGWNDHLLS